MFRLAQNRTLIVIPGRTRDTTGLLAGLDVADIVHVHGDDEEDADGDELIERVNAKDDHANLQRDGDKDCQH